MVALLALYLGLVAQRAWLLVTTGEPVGVVLGVALVVLPVIGAWALVAEVSFGVRTQRIVREMSAEGSLPVDDVPRRPSGRYDRAAADAAFPPYAAAVEDHPDDWRSWFRLGLAYDACGDRRRARRSLRRAIALRSGRGTSD